MTEPLRVGVLGAGLIAGVHVNAYATTSGARVVGVADPVTAKAERLASRAGAVAVAGLDQLLDLGVDAVSVCTPPTTHADLAVRALEAGLHVLCEKPIARTLRDGERIVRAAEDAPGLLMVGHVSRFEPDHRRAKELVDDGAIGPVRMMTHSITTSLPGWSEAGWLTDGGQSGGPLVDLSVHSFDYLTWLVGSEPARVHTVAADSPAGPATYALATVRYACGAMALVEVSWAHPPARGTKLSTELVGPGGRLTWDYDGLMGGTMYRTGGETRWFDPLGERGFAEEVRCFVDAARRGAPSPVPATAGLAALRLSLAALESAQTGTTVDLSIWGR